MNLQLPALRPEDLGQSLDSSGRHLVSWYLLQEEVVDEVEVLRDILRAVSDDVGTASVAIPRPLMDRSPTASGVCTCLTPIADHHVVFLL